MKMLWSLKGSTPNPLARAGRGRSRAADVQSKYVCDCSSRRAKRGQTPFSSQSGLGLLEFVIIVIIISILIVVFFSRVLKLSVVVEREAMQQTVNNLDSALKIEWLTHMVRNQQGRLEALVGSNPMRLLPEPPATYIGELKHPDPAAIPPQRWYYDKTQHLLVYRVANPQAVEGEAENPPRIRFRVAARRDAHGQIQQIELRPMEAYRWAGGT